MPALRTVSSTTRDVDLPRRKNPMSSSHDSRNGSEVAGLTPQSGPILALALLRNHYLDFASSVWQIADVSRTCCYVVGGRHCQANPSVVCKAKSPCRSVKIVSAHLDHTSNVSWNENSL